MRKSLLLATLCAAATPLNGLVAQTRFGAQVSWADERDVGVGARATVDAARALSVRGLEGIASVDWFFPGSDVTYVEVNGNVAYRIPGVTRLAPYVGGGLNIAHSSADLAGGGSRSDTDLGLNVLGGARFGIGPKLKAYTELRIELSGGSQLVATFGVTF